MSEEVDIIISFIASLPTTFQLLPDESIFLGMLVVFAQDPIAISARPDISSVQKLACLLQRATFHVHSGGYTISDYSFMA